MLLTFVVVNVDFYEVNKIRMAKYHSFRMEKNTEILIMKFFFFKLILFTNEHNYNNNNYNL